jgi:hypothetical protein
VIIIGDQIFINSVSVNITDDGSKYDDNINGADFLQKPRIPDNWHISGIRSAGLAQDI